MILSFINIRKVPREGWKPRASPSVFNTSLGTLQMLMNGKSCLIPLINIGEIPFMTTLELLISVAEESYKAQSHLSFKPVRRKEARDVYNLQTNPLLGLLFELLY